jgi:cell division protein FtsQ
MEVMGGDIGRNIFFVPLTERKQALEKVPWVESASVMRFVPNRLRVEIHERTPAAFARVGSKISLIDASGTLMDLPVAAKQKYSFPVVLGMSVNEPASTRAARMKIYTDLVGQLDAGGTHYSQDLSEVDLSDGEDVKVVANDPQGEVLVHLGSSDYLERYKVYVSHVREWRQQFDKLESVDLRYDRQIIVNPDLQGAPKQARLSTPVAKAAAAAGVKPAALITRAGASPKAATVVMPAVKSVAAANRKKSSKKWHHGAVAKGKTKPDAGSTQNKSLAHSTAPPVQSPHAPPMTAPVTSSTQMSAKATPPSETASGALKPGSKPSPSIAKGEAHP